MATIADPTWLTAVTPACEAVAVLLRPHAEVVVHDIERDRIVAIWNPFSGREVGDPSLIAELPEDWRSTPVQGPYRKVGDDGAELSAVSAVLHDDAGTPRGLLCINFDRSPLQRIAALVGELAAPRTERPAELFERDWRERVNLVIDEFVRERRCERHQLGRAERLGLVRELDAAGLFAVRRAAEQVARALGVSRATVYALLKEARA
jgi:predicted transcriptional regulator YheO